MRSSTAAHFRLMANTPDTIIVRNLELMSSIGITSAERATPQRLTVSLEMVPRNEFHTLKR